MDYVRGDGLTGRSTAVNFPPKKFMIINASETKMIKEILFEAPALGSSALSLPQRWQVHAISLPPHIVQDPVQVSSP